MDTQCEKKLTNFDSNSLEGYFLSLHIAYEH